VAFEAVLRQLSAPRFTLPQNLGGHSHDARAATDGAQHVRAVYQNEALLTDFDEHGIATMRSPPWTSTPDASPKRGIG
jgi:hypothetical protein